MNPVLNMRAKLTLGLALLGAAVVCPGCATSSTLVVAESAGAQLAKVHGLRILVLPPSITAQQTETGETLLQFTTAISNLRDKLALIGTEACTQGGNVVVAQCGKDCDPGVGAQGDGPGDLSAQALRAYVPAEVLVRLGELAKAHGCDAVLVQRCQVDHLQVEFESQIPGGPGGFTTGVMDSRPIDSAQFTAAILKIPTGEVVWKNDVLLRKINSGKRFDQAARSLFASLNLVHKKP